MASALEALLARAEAAEGEIEKLTQELAAMKRGAAEVEEPEELVKLRADNSRLKYRVGVLGRAVAEEEAAGQGKHMVDIRGELTGMFQVGPVHHQLLQPLHHHQLLPLHPGGGGLGLPLPRQPALPPRALRQGR